MSQYGVKEVMNFTMAKYVPDALKREPILTVDYATMTDIENAGERVDITGGRGNARLLSFDHSKTVAINVSLPLVDLKMLSLISGDEVSEKVSNIFRKEVMCVSLDSGTGVAYVELKRKPVDGSTFLYKLEGNRDMGIQAIAVDVAPVGDIGVGEMYVDGDNRKIIVDKATFPIGEEIVVFYTSNTGGKVENLRIDPAMFPQTISIFGDTLFRNQYTEEDEVYNVVVHKGRIRPEYTLSMNATDASVLDFTVDVYAFREKCKNRDTYIEYIKDDSEYDFGNANLTAYNLALATIDVGDKALYTPESWAIYQSIVKSNVVNQFDTQAQVDFATATITSAQGLLVTV